MTTLTYDTIQVDDRLSGPGRTIAEADLVQACMVSGDWHPVHCDRVFAKVTPVGEPVLHGGYLTALMLGMAAQLLKFDEPTVLLLGLEKWMFKTPVVAGDTVRPELRLMAKRRTSKGDRGVLTFSQNLINQRAEKVIDGVSNHLLGGRPI